MARNVQNGRSSCRRGYDCLGLQVVPSESSVGMRRLDPGRRPHLELRMAIESPELVVNEVVDAGFKVCGLGVLVSASVQKIQLAPRRDEPSLGRHQAGS